jgi:hypothetical protein
MTLWHKLLGEIAAWLRKEDESFYYIYTAHKSEYGEERRERAKAFHLRAQNCLTELKDIQQFLSTWFCFPQTGSCACGKADSQFYFGEITTAIKSARTGNNAAAEEHFEIARKHLDSSEPKFREYWTPLVYLDYFRWQLEQGSTTAAKNTLHEIAKNEFSESTFDEITRWLMKERYNCGVCHSHKQQCMQRNKEKVSKSTFGDCLAEIARIRAKP